MNDAPTRTGGSRWSRLARSFACAGRGLVQFVATEPNAQIHALATIAVVATGFWLSLGTVEWCLVLLACGLVWAELDAAALRQKLHDLGNEDVRRRLGLLEGG